MLTSHPASMLISFKSANPESTLDFMRAYEWLLINLRPECPEPFLQPRGEGVVEPQVRKEWAGVIHLCCRDLASC